MTRQRRIATQLTSWRWLSLLLVVTAGMFLPAVLQHKPLAPGDGWRVNLPLRAYASRQIAEGHFPSWNPFQFGGSPLHAMTQASVTYPPTLLHLIFSDTTANFLWVLTAYLVAAGGTWLLVKRWTGDGAAAVCAGVVFAFSGFMMAHLGHPAMISTIAFLPAGMWAVDRCIETLSFPRVCLAGGIVGLGMLAGHPQMVLVTAAVLLLWAIFAGLFEKTASSFKPLAVVLLVGALASMIAAIQLLPTAQYLGESERSDLPYELAVELDYPKSHLPLLLYPQAYGAVYDSPVYAGPYQGDGNLAERAGYVGLAGLVFAVYGWQRIRKSPRALALGVVAVVALLVALGDDTPISQIVHRIPFAGQVRAWSRYVVVLNLCVAVFAGFGVARLRSSEESTLCKNDIRRLAGLWGVLLTTALALVLYPTAVALSVNGVDLLKAVAIPLSFAIAATVIITQRGRVATVLSVLCIALVLSDAALSIAWFSEWRLTPIDNEAAAAAIDPDRPSSFGPLFDSDSQVDRVLYIGINSYPIVHEFPPMSASREMYWVNGAEPLAPEVFTNNVGNMAYTGILADPDSVWQHDEFLLDLLHVTTVISDRDWQPAPGALVTESTENPIAAVKVWHRRPALMDAFVVGHSSSVAHGVSGLEDPDVISLQTVPFTGECELCAGHNTPGLTGSVSSTLWTDDTVEIVVSSETPSMLVVSQAYSNGWKARVNGETAPVLRTYGTIQGVPIPAGESHVEIFYEAPGLRVGAMLTLAAVLICLGAVAKHLVVCRRRSPAIA